MKAILENRGFDTCNLGTGHGYSVLNIVKAFEKVNDMKMPYVIKEGHLGGIATCYCNPAKAKAELVFFGGGIEVMCCDS